MKVANPSTFEVINKAYSKDNENVYVYGKILKGADPKTFIKGYTENSGMDEKNLYVDGKKADEIEYFLNMQYEKY